MAIQLLKLGPAVFDPMRVVSFVDNGEGMSMAIFLDGGARLDLAPGEADDFRAWIDGPNVMLKISDGSGLARDPERRKEWGLPPLS